MPESLPQLLRSDAQDNRERVLEAARAIFSERGLAVSMREIARRAGVGPATLYRRFPTKHELITAAFTDELKSCRRIVAEGCADADAWRGLRSVIVRLGELGAHNQGFTDAFLSAFPDAVDFSAHRASLLHELAGLFRRAQADGSLRADAVLDDLILIIVAGRGVSTTPVATRAAAARRFSALAIDALAAVDGRSPLPPPARIARGVIVA